MTPRTARTMTWAALGLLLLGGMIGAPEAGVALTLLAAGCALAAVIYGTKAIRIAAALILLAAVGLSVALFPAAEQSMDGYRDRSQPSPQATEPGK